MNPGYGHHPQSATDGWRYYRISIPGEYTEGTEDQVKAYAQTEADDGTTANIDDMFLVTPDWKILMPDGADPSRWPPVRRANAPLAWVPATEEFRREVDQAGTLKEIDQARSAPLKEWDGSD